MKLSRLQSIRGTASKRQSSCFGCLAVILVILAIPVILLPALNRAREREESSRSDSPSSPSIQVHLANFFVDYELAGGADFVFTLNIKNSDSHEQVVHVIVYGKNDKFSPPRRGAWPAGGLLFRQLGRGRGMLSARAVSANWASLPELAKGYKTTLKHGDSESLEGALPINKTSHHEDWLGQRYDPRSIYDEVHLWVFSETGTLLLERKYNIN